MIGRVSESLIWSYREVREKLQSDLTRARQNRDDAEIARLERALIDLDLDRRQSGIPR